MVLHSYLLWDWLSGDDDDFDGGWDYNESVCALVLSEHVACDVLADTAAFCLDTGIFYMRLEFTADLRVSLALKSGTISLKDTW